MKHKQSCDEHVRTRTGCGECLLRKRLYNKRHTAVLLKNLRMSAPVTVARDRLRQLRALGYSVNYLSTVTGLAPASIWRLSSETQTARVQLRTYWAVERAWLELHQFPAVSDGRAARSAALNGWAPPQIAIDGGPVIDRVSIDRALNGERVPMSPEERAEAARVGAARGLTPTQISEVLHMNQAAVNRYLAGEQPKKRGPKKRAA